MTIPNKKRREITVSILGAGLAMTGCGGGSADGRKESSGELNSFDQDLTPPNLSKPNLNPNLVKAQGLERLQSYVDLDQQAVLDQKIIATWVYYTDLTGSRWYISPIRANQKVGVYSLGPISNGNASWWTCGEAVASVDVNSERVHIDPNLTSGTDDLFYDIGLKVFVKDVLIHQDRKKIQDSSVAIKWYFAYAPISQAWYIIFPKKSGNLQLDVRRFFDDSGRYGWKIIDTSSVIQYQFLMAHALASPTIKLNARPALKFVPSSVGLRFTDRSNDSPNPYGAQCVALAHKYMKSALGIVDSFGFDNHAAPLFDQLGSVKTYESNIFSSVKLNKVINTPSGLPKNGDIIFWNSSVGGGFGHVGIFIEGDLKRFSSLDQNWKNASLTVGSPAAVIEHGWSGVSGWLSVEVAW